MTFSRSAKSRAWNLAFCLGLAVICAFALIKAGKWTLAEHYRNQASDIIQGWNENQDASLEEWNRADAIASKALALNDTHPVLYYLKGYLHEWRATLPYPVDESLAPEARDLATAELAFADLLSAVDAYRMSLAQAPSLPDTWARLATSKLALGTFDEEFAAAYTNAWFNGRNLAHMQLALTNLSLGFFWEIFEDPNLTPIQEAHFQAVLRQNNVAPHLDLMRRFDLLTEICLLTLDPEWTISAATARACVQVLGTEFESYR